MRNNQPITQDEFRIVPGMSLMSRTDLKGNIVECNDAFVIASGYSKSELIGQPHNLIRHPDVPEAVFKDMWATIKMGGTWSQVVKNRRKDGGFYWVKANVSPLYSQGQHVGYVSVREYVNDSQKSAAADVYKALAAGRAKIKFGQINPKVVLNPLAHLGITWQIILYNLIVLIPLFVALQFFVEEVVLRDLLMVLGTVAVQWWIGRNISATLQDINNAMKAMREGQIPQLQGKNPQTFMGSMMACAESAGVLSTMRMVQAQDRLQSFEQLREAMKQLSVNVMIADSNYNIVFINDAIEAFFKKNEAVFKSVLPNFEASRVLGSNIDIFHKNPSHQRAMLDALNQGHVSRIEVGDHHFELFVYPVKNDLGQRIETLLEWRDRTQEVRLSEYYHCVIERAIKGVFDSRIDTQKLDGIFLMLAEQINRLIDTIEGPIDQSVMVSTALSEGHLDKEMTGEMHGRFALMKDALNMAATNLASMMTQLSVGAKTVYSAVLQIHASSQSLNDRTQQQAAAVEQTAAAMEQITSIINQNADKTLRATELTNQASANAEKGAVVMNEAIKSMEEISASSQKIADIIKLIDSIAFQTNLLALNAAVEAARAGEHGRGFAVVAGEVRSLAQKSAEAAKDIRQLIEASVSQISTGTQQVKASGDALTQIVQSVQEVKTITAEISTSNQEQARGVAQVNQAITDIDSGVQQNAAMVEETAATSEELAREAQKMIKSVDMFKFDAHRFHSPVLEGLVHLDVDFPEIRRTHRQWRVKTRAYINDAPVEFSRNQAANAANCSLGKWLYGSGKQFSAMAEFIRLEKLHAELHAFIGKVLDVKDGGDADKANEMMVELEKRSNEVVEAVTQLETALAGGYYETDRPKPQAPSGLAKKPATIPASATSKTTGAKPALAAPPTARVAAAPAKAAPKKSGSMPQGQAHASDEWEDF